MESVYEIREHLEEADKNFCIYLGDVEAFVREFIEQILCISTLNIIPERLTAEQIEREEEATHLKSAILYNARRALQSERHCAYMYFARMIAAVMGLHAKYNLRQLRFSRCSLLVETYEKVYAQYIKEEKWN